MDRIGGIPNRASHPVNPVHPVKNPLRLLPFRVFSRVSRTVLLLHRMPPQNANRASLELALCGLGSSAASALLCLVSTCLLSTAHWLPLSKVLFVFFPFAFFSRVSRTLLLLFSSPVPDYESRITDSSSFSSSPSCPAGPPRRRRPSRHPGGPARVRSPRRPASRRWRAEGPPASRTPCPSSN